MGGFKAQGVTPDSARYVIEDADAGFGQQGYAQGGHVGYQAGDFGLRPVGFGLGHFEHEFVMHLHEDAAGPALLVQGGLHGDHGADLRLRISQAQAA